ncbi:MAG: hypothetical protein JRJ29_00755 [Deltaproteobacteria bacterium]|nr:hypothetical protein [Deltaproteobacteria bacterium]
MKKEDVSRKKKKTLDHSRRAKMIKDIRVVKIIMDGEIVPGRQPSPFPGGSIPH